MSGQNPNRHRAVAFLFENSIFLIGGALAALIWANISPDSYKSFVEFDLSFGYHAQAEDHGDDKADANSDAHDDDKAHQPDGQQANNNADDADQDDKQDDADHGANDDDDKDDNDKASAETDPDKTDSDKDKADKEHGDSEHHGVPIHFLVNDILMALFFAIAGSEVWEALLPGGALSDPKKAATPLLATVGGIVGPAGIYLLGVAWLDDPSLTNGWAIPCATDIAFSYLIARFIFGPGHPAIAFLLLLAIADDAAGLIILAVAYPSGDLNLLWLLLSGLAMGIGFGFRKMNLHSFWWYLLIPGTMSWLSFYFAGIHPALGLIPVIITKPHAHTDLGIFAREELDQDDTLNQFVKAMADPVEVILGLFGLVNAGVLFSAIGDATWLVLAGLLIGKPLGITAFTWFSEKVLKLEMPKGMNYRDVVTLGTIAAIGFTVALFVSTAAFKGNENLAAAKMGALASFIAAALAIVLAKMLGIKRFTPDSEEEASNTEAPH